MLIYILYNADLLQIPWDANGEDAVGYVDNIMLLATGDGFEETTNTLKDMVERPNGAFEWSTEHNTRFEISKTAILHCSKKTATNEDGENIKLYEKAPPLILRGQTIEAVSEYKYLGVLIDRERNWGPQTMRAVKLGSKRVAQLCRITR